jgi:hypothetical protein
LLWISVKAIPISNFVVLTFDNNIAFGILTYRHWTSAPPLPNVLDRGGKFTINQFVVVLVVFSISTKLLQREVK